MLHLSLSLCTIFPSTLNFGDCCNASNNKGEHVQEGYQSLAYSIRFLNKEATLQEEEIKQAMDRIQTALVALDDVTIR